MNFLILIIEIIITFTLLFFCHKLFGKKGLIGWISVAAIIANIEACKSATILTFDISLGNVIFASIFLATDILTELYGEKEAKDAINIAFFTLLAYIVSTQFCLLYNPSTLDTVNNSMNNVLKLSLRVCLSSALMFYLANKLDIYVYNKLRKKYGNEKVWLRNNLSTILSNCLENFLFILAAFYGLYNFHDCMLIACGTSIIEIIIALLDTPYLYLTMKKANLFKL